MWRGSLGCYAAAAGHGVSSAARLCHFPVIAPRPPLNLQLIRLYPFVIAIRRSAFYPHADWRCDRELNDAFLIGHPTPLGPTAVCSSEIYSHVCARENFIDRFSPRVERRAYYRLGRTERPLRWKVSRFWPRNDPTSCLFGVRCAYIYQ